MNEGLLLSFALSTTATRGEERCQQLRNALPGAVDGANRAHERRSVRVWRDPKRGTLTLNVELPVEAGDLVCQALDKAVEAGVGISGDPMVAPFRRVAISRTIWSTRGRRMGRSRP